MCLKIIFNIRSTTELNTEWNVAIYAQRYALDDQREEADWVRWAGKVLRGMWSHTRGILMILKNKRDIRSRVAK